MGMARCPAWILDFRLSGGIGWGGEEDEEPQSGRLLWFEWRGELHPDPLLGGDHPSELSTGRNSGRPGAVFDLRVGFAGCGRE